MKLDEEKITLDFKSDNYLAFELDRLLYKQLQRGIIIKIWKRFPVKNFKPQPDEKKDPEFDISIEECMLGFVVINLSEFVKDCKLDEIKFKYPVFEYSEDFLKYYNIYWPNKREPAYKESHKEEIESQRKEKYSKKIEEDLGKKDQKGPGGAPPKKPDPKKKKPTGPATGGKKVQEEEVKIVPKDYPIHSRSEILYTDDYTGKQPIDSYKEKQGKVIVAGSSLLSVFAKIY